MDGKELKDFLVKFGEGNRGKFVPWWDVNLEDCIYKYDLFSEEEVSGVTECVKLCSGEELSEPIGQTGFTIFHLLVWCGFYEAAEAALENGVEADIPAVGAAAGVTPLMAACYRGNLQMVKLLLDKKADSGLCDEQGRNAFHYLAGVRIANLSNFFEVQKNGMVQREPIAQLLSGDINAKDEQNKTPFEELLKDNNADYSWALAGIFLEKGADVQGKDEEGNSLLMTAIKKRNITAAFRLMEDKELVNLPNNEGMTPLHLAVERHMLELCMALLSKGADKNIQDGSGKTPKDMALEIDNGDFKQFFTSGRLNLSTLSRLASNAFAGCSSDQRDGITMALYLSQKLIREVDTDDDEEMGYILNILYSALLNDEKCQVLDMLQEAGIDFTAPIHSGSVKCIRDYCLGGNFGTKVIRKFLDLGLDMDAPVIKGKTPANIVASLQKRTMMQGKKDPYFEEAAELFSRESMEYVDNMGTTAMHEAARNDHVDMLRVMIGKGADVNIAQDAPADAGNTPLHVACVHGKGKAAKLLMESGADDTIQNVNGETPAHLAVTKKRFGRDLQSNERAEVLEALEHVDVARNDGKTPLILLQDLDINSAMELLPILLEKGVDVNHADDRGNTALIANTQNQCYKGIVKELVRAGADVNAVNKEGNTPLYYALRYGNQESAIFLLKKGADYNHANNEGVTPAQVAAEKGYDTVLELMTDIA